MLQGCISTISSAYSSTNALYSRNKEASFKAHTENATLVGPVYHCGSYPTEGCEYAETNAGVEDDDRLNVCANVDPHLPHYCATRLSLTQLRAELVAKWGPSGGNLVLKLVRGIDDDRDFPVECNLRGLEKALGMIQDVKDADNAWHRANTILARTPQRDVENVLAAYKKISNRRDWIRNGYTALLREHLFSRCACCVWLQHAYDIEGRRQQRVNHLLELQWKRLQRHEEPMEYQYY
ncbi:unnamed protein product [Vitrella brassicaformis CCMP3155]|uniref:Uncharacterized protein n=1 Tax=Vitrella brassicaformis (strain CCMP3155) TaxID=1169540 RepID=A0A0G4EZK4_VITBC|nr:unnamed protein product [Vitrella brassicaformis CCMP3155]|eukprot:CEM04242.1 unnamed protein product [Vitrella brassicaformis CCMP3155]